MLETLVLPSVHALVKTVEQLVWQQSFGNM